MTMFPRLATLLTAAALLTFPALAGGPLEDARAAVKGAEMDLSDARSYLADLKAGDFAGMSQYATIMKNLYEKLSDVNVLNCHSSAS